MEIQTKIKKTGPGTACIIIPKEQAEIHSLHFGDIVTVSITKLNQVINNEKN